MHRSRARYSAPVSFVQAPSWADFITTMVGFEVFGTHSRFWRKADIRPPLEKPKKPILAAQDGRGQHRRASAAPICAKLFWLVRLRERIVRRREFIALVSSAAAIQPLGARADRPPERILYFTYSAGSRHDAIA